jgi:hypothetical protein
LTLFKRNVSLHFAGVTECAICYSIISVNDRSLPNRSCKTCDNSFHASCLYKVRFFLLSILPSSIESSDERALPSELEVVQHESQLVLPSVQESVLDHDRNPSFLEDFQPPSPSLTQKLCSAEQRDESLRLISNALCPSLSCPLRPASAYASTSPARNCSEKAHPPNRPGCPAGLPSASSFAGRGNRPGSRRLFRPSADALCSDHESRIILQSLAPLDPQQSGASKSNPTTRL